MLRQLSIIIFISAAICAGCQNHVSKATSGEKDGIAVKAGKLTAHLGTANNVFTKDSVMLSFSAINDADTVQRFCKWETPFEPRLGKYFNVTDDQGNEALFTGAMARRVMPPPAEAYIEVPAHDSVTTVFNLAENYSVSGGQYIIKYTGSGVSGLEAGNEVKITIPKP